MKQGSCFGSESEGASYNGSFPEKNMNLFFEIEEQKESGHGTHIIFQTLGPEQYRYLKNKFLLFLYILRKK